MKPSTEASYDELTDGFKKSLLNVFDKRPTIFSINKGHGFILLSKGGPPEVGLLVNEIAEMSQLKLVFFAPIEAVALEQHDFHQRDANISLMELDPAINTKRSRMLGVGHELGVIILASSKHIEDVKKFWGK